MTFHKTIGFPKELGITNDKLRLVYTKHAMKRIGERCLDPKVPINIKITKRKLVEVFTNVTGKRILTCLVRMQYNRTIDITLALKPNFKKLKATVLTVWFNHKKDKHKTLNKLKYDKP